MSSSLLRRKIKVLSISFFAGKSEHGVGNDIQVTAGRISQLRYKGNNFDFAKDATENPSEVQGLSSNHSTALCSALNFGRAGVIVSVICFTAIFVVSHFVLLCDKWVLQGWD